MMLKILLAALLAYVLSQTTESPSERLILRALKQVFLEIDTNGDDAITISEQYAYFDKVDLNDDGKMSFNEFAKSRLSGPTITSIPDRYLHATFDWYDTLGGTSPANGFLERNETSYFFDIVDVNGDGVAGLAEFDIVSLEIGVAIVAQAANATDSTQPIG